MKTQKRISRLLVCVMLLSLLLTPVMGSRAANVGNATKRAIYVVFDNSGSMYGPKNMAWSQATYAMEVFAAMMNYENGDTMKVFPMHPVTTGSGGQKNSMTIASQADIAQIHNMYTPNPGGTPYKQVNTAATELAKVLKDGKYDEGWLVVLTDGDFDANIPDAGLREDLRNKAKTADNFYVQYLAIGKEVKNIPEGDGEIGFYAQKAADSSAVVNELAEISNRIFKRNEYKEYKKGEELKFDIPLSKLIVFAQGKDVKVNGLSNKEGGKVNLQSSCKVSYSNTDGAGKTSYVTETPTKDTSLKGEVAIFADESAIMEGTYTLDVSGADTIQVYYEPDVKFGVKLYKDGKLVEDPVIEGGAYTLKVGFVNRLSGEFIESSSLLGEPTYTLKMNGEEYDFKNNGGTCQEIPLEIDGDTFDVEAGVTYLSNYSDTDQFTLTVCTLELEMEAPKSMTIKTLESGDNEVIVTATKNGAPLTEEQWNNATIDVKTYDSEDKEFPIEWEVQKGSKVSTWVLTPKYKDGDMFATGTGEAKVVASVATDIDGETYGSAQSETIKIKDNKTLLDFIKRYWKEIIISLLLLILLLGYVPPFKKRFSRKMKRRPSIECASEKVGVHDMIVKGNFEKDLISVLLPYKAETGRLTFSPAPVKKTAKVKSTGGSGMLILNTSAYAGKDEITFNGMSIPEGYKGHYRITASAFISVSTPEFTYTCTPNVQRSADGGIKKSRGKGKKKRR